MCLSTIYRDAVTEQNILMKNVKEIACHDGMVVLTDLLDRQMALQGGLVMASLVDGYAVVKERSEPAAITPRWAGNGAFRQYTGDKNN